MRFLFPLLIIIPMVELALLIKVGQTIGVLSTLLLVIGTALLGSYILRKQGAAALWRAQEKMRRGELPAKEMVEGLFIGLGGVLLLTPGVMTDVMGLLCLLPATRAAAIRWAARHIKVAGAGQGYSPFGGFDQRGFDETHTQQGETVFVAENDKHQGEQSTASHKPITLEGEFERKE
ncbi:hypothetical protein WH50_18875 [Pokkaliibacter plantistimulans]|uniref:Exlusion protein FxsA n=1 Tax=Pokkaliibacter plantistimulans TaxID=1635171 RepID=A0ABX5LT01_9GAMM|nr:FxsA family protein [Pokkaliibacter plantistimulans]PXF29801.1 hypothetical protein WH50_18875 [Pokkaliibacter plantistimulans]